MKCCKENHQARRTFFAFLAWACCTISHHNSVGLWAAGGWTSWFSRQIPWSLLYLIFSVSHMNGCTKNAEFEFLFSEELAMHSSHGNEPSQVCIDVQVHKSRFSKKYFPVVPEVLLLTVFGKIMTLLSLEHNDSRVLPPEAVAAHWAFFLINGTRRGYFVSSQKKHFFQRQKRVLQSPLTVLYVLWAS